MGNEVWYALKVRPRLEKQVSANLSAKGYELFLPLYKRKSRWSDRIKTLEEPLFPGYLFCQFDVTKRLPILQTPGVMSVVGIGKCPEPINPAEIEAIRTVVLSGVGYHPHPYLAVGDSVEVEHGALAGLVGLITQVKNEFRLIISVNLLMRSVSVEIERSWVSPQRSPVRERIFPGVGANAATEMHNASDWQLRRIG
jgi:transcription antitermination factor NusG